MSEVDVVVLGAGPYGLSAAAHLAAIKGLDVRVFGEPMEFWRSHMPAGMFLRSPRCASSLSDPRKELTIDGYFAALAHHDACAAIPLERFVDYGLWFQRSAVSRLERRRVRAVERDPVGFRVALEDGETFLTRRVVVAGGIGPFARRLDVFSALPRQLVSHCSDHRDVARFKDQRVVVVGGGQSALESAALIREAGGEVEVLVRQETIRWHGRSGGAAGAAKKVLRLGFIRPLLYADTGVGPIGISRIVAFPNSLKYFPRKLQDEFRLRSLRASGSWNLFERVQSLTLSLERHVVRAREDGGRARLTLNDGSERLVDHVLLATGYKVDVSRYGFLSRELVESVRTTDGYPRLTAGFESSVPGLHFLGAPATWSYGPLMHFVAGTPFAASRLARRIARERGRAS